MDIRFGDHPSFHRAAAGMVGASAALGLGLSTLSPIKAPVASLVAGLLGIAIGASFAYGKTHWRMAAAAAACVPLFVITPTWGMMAAIAGLMALAIAAYGLRGVKGALAVMFGAAVSLLAMWAAIRIGFAKQTYGWDAWMRDTAGASAMGMIGVLAVLPRHLRFALDPVSAAARRLPNDLDSEVRDLCNRSLAIWTSAKDKLAVSDPGMTLVRDGVLKTLEVAIKTSDVKAAGASDQQLAKRSEDLDARIAAASDPEVKTQYQAARAALDDQRRYRDHIQQNRERLIARMHNHVAALEKFQLAAGGLVAARAASAGATAVKQLEELSNDVAASGEALAELEIGNSETTATTAETTPEAEAKPAQA